MKRYFHQLSLRVEYFMPSSAEVLYLTLISADPLGSHYLQESVRIGVSLVEWSGGVRDTSNLNQERCAR